MKYLSLLIMAAMVSAAFAQADLTWGVKAGMNLSQHYGAKGDDLDFEVKSGLRPGFITGAYLDFAANDNLSLVIEALYSTKGSRQKITIIRMEDDPDGDGIYEMVDLEKPAIMDVKYFMDYFEVPVLLKLRTLKASNWALHLITGTAMSIKVKGRHELEGKVFLPDGDDFSEIPITESSDLSSVNMFDFSFIYGGAVDLPVKFPLSVEYRFTLGWDYLALPTYQFFEPVQLRNQAWSLMLSTRF
ncbi:MAG TPA: porin family protein [Candidatus Cloacimonadota bacterium]|nr:porin family protein [Candidatus Cloacimonadota bacterium]